MSSRLLQFADGTTVEQDDPDQVQHCPDCGAECDMRIQHCECGPECPRPEYQR